MRFFDFGFGIRPGDALGYQADQLSARVVERQRPSPSGDAWPPPAAAYRLLAAAPSARRGTQASPPGAAFAHFRNVGNVANVEDVANVETKKG